MTTFRTDSTLQLPSAGWAEPAEGLRYRRACRRTQAQITARATDAAASVSAALNAVTFLTLIDGPQTPVADDLRHVQTVLQRILIACYDSEASLATSTPSEPPGDKGVMGRAS